MNAYICVFLALVLKQRKGVILVDPGKIVICEWNSDMRYLREEE